MNFEKKSKSDVPVLLIFFNRSETLKKVFEKVRENRPSILFLACDGPRDKNEEDIKKIAECKAIVENIDWECTVYREYSDVNMGCGMRPQTAISKAFEIVDRLVVLEDDCIPHTGFFEYMSEMLERYKEDSRIGLISAFNHFLNWDCGEYSYFFTKVGPMGGAWGSWRRVWKDYSYSVSEINNPLVERLISEEITLKRAKKEKILLWKNTVEKLRSNENISYWDVQFGFLKFYKSYLTIVPKHSLASNVGLGKDSTHAVNAQNVMPSIFFSEDKKLKLPLKHPEFVICDHSYDNAVDGKYGFPNKFKKQLNRIFRLLKRILKF